VSTRVPHPASDTEWSAALAQQWLSRYGIVSRHVAALEGVAGGFSAVYDVMRTLEERGKIRRGYFASGVGAMQFALPPALEMLRSLRAEPETAEVVVIAATDPANPYGAVLAWPSADTGGGTAARGPTRTVGSTVVLVNGRLGAYVGRHGRPLLSYLPGEEPDHAIVGRGVASALADLARLGEGRHGGLLVAEINGKPAAGHPLAEFLPDAGFVKAALGYQVRRPPVDRGGGRRPAPGAESG
jgi:ATP-dependent Lhr-like helicase